jgi:DNA-directed RNA polymerase alpha subunit
MAKQWWHFIPRLGWQRCTEREAEGFKAELGEGEKVAHVDERVPLDAVLSMKRPVAYVHPDALNVLMQDHDTAEWFATTRIEIRQNSFLSRDVLTFIDHAEMFKPLFNVSKWL